MKDPIFRLCDPICEPGLLINFGALILQIRKYAPSDPVPLDL